MAYVKNWPISKSDLFRKMAYFTKYCPTQLSKNATIIANPLYFPCSQIGLARQQAYAASQSMSSSALDVPHVPLNFVPYGNFYGAIQHHQTPPPPPGFPAYMPPFHPANKIAEISLGTLNPDAIAALPGSMQVITAQGGSAQIQSAHPVTVSPERAQNQAIEYIK